MKRFSCLDENFVCAHCGVSVQKLGYSSRNHCPNCLHSLHVDIFPGDRQNTCNGLLVPQKVEVNSKKGFVILFKCERCGTVSRNKAADDDNKDLLIKLTKEEIK